MDPRRVLRLLLVLRCPSSVDGRGRVLLDHLPRDGVRAQRVSRGECTLLDVDVAGCVAHRMDPWTPARIEVPRCRVRRDGCRFGRLLIRLQDVRPYFQIIIRPSFLGSSSSLFGSACDSGVTKIEDLAFRHRLVCSLSYTWSKRSIPTLLTPPDSTPSCCLLHPRTRPMRVILTLVCDNGCYLLRPHRPRDRRAQGCHPPHQRARGRHRHPHPVRCRQGLRPRRVSRTSGEADDVLHAVFSPFSARWTRARCRPHDSSGPRVGCAEAISDRFRTCAFAMTRRIAAFHVAVPHAGALSGGRHVPDLGLKGHRCQSGSG